MKGSTYFTYDDNVFCASSNCSPGALGAWPQTWGGSGNTSSKSWGITLVGLNDDDEDD
jgi:hypothetical protein